MEFNTTNDEMDGLRSRLNAASSALSSSTSSETIPSPSSSSTQQKLNDKLLEMRGFTPSFWFKSHTIQVFGVGWLFIQVIVLILLHITNNTSAIRWGPGPELYCLWLLVDTWNKWFLMILYLSYTSFCLVYVSIYCQTALSKYWYDANHQYRIVTLKNGEQRLKRIPWIDITQEKIPESILNLNFMILYISSRLIWQISPAQIDVAMWTVLIEVVATRMLSIQFYRLQNDQQEQQEKDETIDERIN